MRTEIYFCAHRNFPACARRFFALRKEAFFLPQSNLFSSVGKDVFLRRKESLRSKGKDLRRVLKKRIGGRDTPAPPIRFFRYSTGKSGATPVEGRWKRYCFFSGGWLGDEDETIRWDTRLEPLLELGLLRGGERLA